MKTLFPGYSKKMLVFTALLFSGFHTLRIQAQGLSVNTSGASAHASAMLDVSSSNKGILIPRIALTGVNDNATIPGPATGLLIYNLTLAGELTPGYYYWNGTSWTRLLNGAAWSLTGNSGTNATTNFIGTTDNVPLNFRVNNQSAGMIDGVSNVFLGYQSGSSNVGNGNTAIGFNAMYSTTTGFQNTAMGQFALGYISTGAYNTAMGSAAMMWAAAGNYNTALGFDALMHNNGYANTVVGSDAMNNNGTGSDNVSLGYQSLKSNDDGNKNVAAGRDALYNNHSGSENTALGYQALWNNYSGNHNVAVGPSALYNNNSSHDNVAIGYDPLYNNSGSANIAIGSSAMGGFNSGTANVAIGNSALGNNTTGNWNLAAGESALQQNFNGNYNTALGYRALGTNGSGSKNVAIGFNSMYTAGITAGDDNVVIGSYAGAANVNGSSNVLIGNGADVTTSVSSSVALGPQAKVSASNSIVLGAPGTNVGIGLSNPSNLLHVYGFGDEQVTIENPFAGLSEGILLKSAGNGVARIEHNGSYLKIEDWDVSTSWGGLVIKQGKVGINTATPSAQLSVNGTADNATGTWGVYSDARVKTIDRSFTDGLNVIRRINPVVFHYNNKAPYPVAETQVGVVAQELERIAPYMVSQRAFNDFSDLREVNNQAYVFLLINAVKEQQQRIEQLEKEVRDLVRRSK